MYAMDGIIYVIYSILNLVDSIAIIFYIVSMIYIHIWCVIYYVSYSTHPILHAMNIGCMIYCVYDVTSYISSLYNKIMALISYLELYIRIWYMSYIILVGVAGDRVLGRYGRVINFNNRWWHVWRLVQISMRQPPGFTGRSTNDCIHNQRGRSKTPKSVTLLAYNRRWHMWRLVQISMRQASGFPGRFTNHCIHNQRGRSKTPKSVTLLASIERASFPKPCAKTTFENGFCELSA